MDHRSSGRPDGSRTTRLVDALGWVSWMCLVDVSRGCAWWMSSIIYTFSLTGLSLESFKQENLSWSELLNCYSEGLRQCNEGYQRPSNRNKQMLFIRYCLTDAVGYRTIGRVFHKNLTESKQFQTLESKLQLLILSEVPKLFDDRNN